jgi:hypothetical protein
LQLEFPSRLQLEVSSCSLKFQVDFKLKSA